jgi:uncharacterized membrane protein
MILVAAVFSAVVLRWFHLGGQSLWYDEGNTIWLSGPSPANIFRLARSITSPPFYFLLQHYWGALFGNSEYALRALPALFGTLSLPVFYFLAKKLLKDSMAVALAMWIFAFSLMQLWYSRDARPYDLISFLALVGLYALVLFLEKRSAALFAIIVLAIDASIYSHNMMFFYLLALNVAWLTYPSERTWIQRVKELLVADFLAVVLYLPWVPGLLAQVADVHENFWATKPTVSTLIQTLTVIGGFDLDYLTAVVARLLPLSSHMAWACVVGGVSLLCAVLVAGGLWRVPRADRSRNLSLLLYCLLPILLVFVLSLITKPIFIDRVFISSSVIVPIVFAYPVALQKGRRGRIFYGVLGILLAGTTALSGFGYLRIHENENWRGAIGSLLRIPEKDRLIVFLSRTEDILFDYYAQKSRMDPGAEKMGLPTNFDVWFASPEIIGPIRAGDIAPLKLAVESRRYSEIDLVLSHESARDPNEVVLNYLNQVLTRQEEQKFYGVRIVRFRAPQF